MNVGAEPIAGMIDAVIAREGGYVAHPSDHGGPTKYGITQASLTTWRNAPVDAEDVAALTREEAAAIFRALYFERPGLARLPHALQPFMLDCSVHHGPRAAVRLLQRVLNAEGHACAADGVLGRETAQVSAAAHAVLGSRLIDRLVDGRLAVLERIIRRDPAQAVFYAGWRRRVESLRPG